MFAQAQEQAADSPERGTLGGTGGDELLAERQQGQQAHDGDHVHDRLDGPEDNRSKGQARVRLPQDRIHRDRDPGTRERRDQQEQHSRGHAVPLCGDLGEVVRTGQIGPDGRTKQVRDSRSDEQHSRGDGEPSVRIHLLSPVFGAGPPGLVLDRDGRALRRDDTRARRPSTQPSRAAGSPTYVAETVLGLAVCHLDVSPADSAASGSGVKPLAISQTAMTISCRASGAMKTPSESPNMLPSGATM